MAYPSMSYEDLQKASEEERRKRRIEKATKSKEAKTEETKKSDTATTGPTAGTNTASAMGQSAAAGGSPMDVSSSGLMAYGASTGDPYLIAAAAGLGVASQTMKNKRERERQEITDEMNRRQLVMNAMSNLGTGVGSIG